MNYGLERLELRKSNLQNDLMDQTKTPRDYQDIKHRVEKDLVLVKDKLTDLQQQASPFKIYILKEVPMLENLLEYYRKSAGAKRKRAQVQAYSLSLLLSLFFQYPERTKVATFFP